MKRLIYVLLLAALLLPSPPGLSEKGHFIRNVRKEPKTGEKITYWVYEPPEVTEGLPLVIYLHGSSERGENALATSLPLFITRIRSASFAASSMLWVTIMTAASVSC